MLAIITYDISHRKTQDLVSKLILNGYSDIHLVVIPWIERENYLPIFKHRPSNKVLVTIEEMCERLNLQFSRVDIKNLDKYFIKNQFENILIGGAGILPGSLSKNYKIINSHPGYLPNMKGLDAFKWSIYEGQPIGVTTHYISNKADEGELIEKTIIPIYFEDTFHSVAYRVYETEIEMLVNSIRQIKNKDSMLESLADDRYVANRRMPHHLEIIMMNRFEDLRKKSKSFRRI
jgi:phosphoribosylglycinamide formyltransferase-1